MGQIGVDRGARIALWRERICGALTAAALILGLKVGAAFDPLAAKAADMQRHSSAGGRVQLATGWQLNAARSVIHRQVAALWIWFIHVARWCYLGIEQRSPAMAGRWRARVAPFIRAGNRAILRSEHGPAVRHRSGHLANGGKPFHLAFQAAPPVASFAPLVTVIVPNYNHAPFLRQRLDSIYAQSWTNFEVILLDDASSDGSRDILSEYAARHAGRTRVLFNSNNSGGPFHQWEAGMRAARGDLIWIAESDDWCSLNFLETLVPFFANTAVQLAYAPSLFMSADGSTQVWSMAEYLYDLGPARWQTSFVTAGAKIVREVFAERNIIPCTSSAVFRRTDRLEVQEVDLWRGMKACGDWVFYLNQIRGGLLAYSPDARNYYRQHGESTSARALTGADFYSEHESVACCVQRHYSVDPDVFRRQKVALAMHWRQHRPDVAVSGLDRFYRLPAIAAEAERRKPRLLMAGYALCSGGGETLPITLANAMKTAGYSVTYLNCQQEPDQPGIASQLARDIPVVSDLGDLNRIVQDFGIDVIHSHHAWVDNTVLDLLPPDSLARTVVTLHGMYETLSNDQLKRILPRLLKCSAQIVYVAEKNIRALTSAGLADPWRLVRIENALARGPVTPVDRARIGIGPQAFVLTLVSRALAAKGWQEAIDAVTLARRKSGRDVHLVLVGDGPEYTRLNGKVPHFVHLQGVRGNPRDYFAMADAGILPSRFAGESFPLAIIDCLFAGRPMVATDLGEIRQMLATAEGPAGAVVSLQDWQVPVADLAQVIAELSGDPAQMNTLRRRAEKAANRFDLRRMRDQYDDVYLAACDEPVLRIAAE